MDCTGCPNNNESSQCRRVEKKKGKENTQMCKHTLTKRRKITATPGFHSKMTGILGKCVYKGVRWFLNYHIAAWFKKAKSNSPLIGSQIIEISIMRMSKHFHPRRDFKTDPKKTLRLKYPLGVTPIHICLDILNINSCGKE